MANIIFDYEMVDEIKRRAEQFGGTPDDFAKRAGLSMGMMNAARAAYVRTASANGWDEDAKLSSMDEKKYQQFCTAFMLDADKYIVKDPPVKGAEEKKPETTDLTEDLLQLLEDLSRQIRANTVQITNLREDLRSQHKERLAKLPDERAALAAEDAAGALKTTNRALDAIDNKLATIIAALTRVTERLDRGNNAALDAANKLKSIAEGVAGLLGKLTRLCALYEKPRAR